ncbi:glycosyltransferase family 1 protein [Fibrisoma montanum]|uniref:Glycosyltransferase family 1 protein n=1 Tax=Fibrisoma montanum TaxID=2305895 RepID=A0A418M0A9_9BACT|nr:glycosyltransferase family 1 protein [Fibrisoma montanum]RIV19017.1 glycosyltransferase family 1 protein [Fibrisoma montanum]
MKVTDSTPLTDTQSLSISSVPSVASTVNAVSSSTTGETRDLVCFSHLRWNFVYQRPQHLLTRATRNYRVWFIEEPVFGNDLRMAVCTENDRLRVVVPHLPHGSSPDDIIRYQRQLIDELLQKERITDFVAWYYTPMALFFSDHLKPRLTVYDCMDELSAFWGAPKELLDQEKRLMDKAGIMFTGGYSLFEAKQRRHPHVFAFPSSIDFTHFSSARRPLPDPVDQRSLPNPRIGFSGVIDERFDYELLGELAERRRDWHFIMIGPIVKINPALLPKGPNVHYLGMKDYKQLPAYFSNWNVAMLPFAMNESTRFISPTKTPEYLSAGLPVVSTPIRDVVRTYGSQDFVQIADTAKAFEAAIELALQQKHPSDWSAIDTFLAESSWDCTWGEMNRLMTAQMEIAVEQ